MRRRDFVTNTAAMGMVMAAASVPDMFGRGSLEMGEVRELASGSGNASVVLWDRL